MADEEVTEETEEHPEPKPVGATVVQDNVSEPGVQHTHQVGPDGEVLQTSSHGADDTEAVEDSGLDGAAAKAEAERLGLLDEGEDEPSGEVESDSALVGSGPGEGEEQGDGGDGPKE
jgi:hypothetical protein